MNWGLAKTKAARVVRLVPRGWLSIVGFAALVAAAWTFALWAGLVALGLACLLIDWMTDNNESPGQQGQQGRDG